ncbi:cysteine rich repeat-containing protein [Bradyrhizobium sp.]|uniref:cysteine rich repeat-containing protein n=1 Tax=Bradyrhizobium sp. TaxID=376 RepID=UPI003C4A3C85
MLKLRLAVLICVTGLPGSAPAQGPSSEQRTACKPDYDKYCSGTMPGGGRIIACLNKQYDQLGDACKKVLDARKK